MSGPVYVVRLTEDFRRLALKDLRLCEHPSLEILAETIDVARPEEPGRQEALERLGRAVIPLAIRYSSNQDWVMDNDASTNEFLGAMQAWKLATRKP